MSPGAQLIGIALFEHLGDIVASEPIVRRVRKENPTALIVWFVGARYVEIAQTHPDIDIAVPLRHLSDWIILRKFGFLDRKIDLHLPGRVCRTCDTTLVKSSGNSSMNKDNYYLFGNLLAVMLRNAGLPLFDEGPRLHVPAPTVRRIDGLMPQDPFICIHCRSNEASRDWDRTKWEELIRTLTRTYGLHVVEVGLEATLSAVAYPRYTSLCGRLSLVATAEVIRRAAVFVGIDSGPAHLANAVGTYGIILLGRYRNFPGYMPYSGMYADGTNAKILRHDGPLHEMPVQPVLAALLRQLERSGNRNTHLDSPSHCPGAGTE